MQTVDLNRDGDGVFLKISELQPVNQMKMNLRLKSADGKGFDELVYLTINRVPGS